MSRRTRVELAGQAFGALSVIAAMKATGAPIEWDFVCMHALLMGWAFWLAFDFGYSLGGFR